MLPNGNALGCAACHNNPGGGGARNAFGLDVEAIVGGPSSTPFWTAALAAEDSDEDDFTNGEEVGDPEGDGTVVSGWIPTNPGDPSSKPAVQVDSLKALIEGDPNLSEFEFALRQAELIDALDGEGPFTVFASPNSAWVALPPHYVQGLLANTNATTSVLLYHVLEGDLRDADLTARRYETLEGNTIQVSENSGNKFVNGFDLLTVDRVADNGVLHEVAGVLTPPPPPAIEISSQRNVDQLQLSWTGGKGSFRLEKASDLDAPGWVPEVVTPERTASVSIDDVDGFFRVVDNVQLGAGMRASFVVPPLSQPGSGKGQFRLLGTQLTYTIRYGGLQSPVTAAHIHGPADTNETAGVLFTLIPGKASAGQTSGTIPPNGGERTDTIPQELADALLEGKAYLNFHTEADPGGAIRGQILPLP
jgi:uncharacterized surface protein with fasciclin (FAS1) repeats